MSDTHSPVSAKWLVVWVITSSAFFGATSLPQAPREYCEAETFRATCSAEEVVLVTTAEYGRMRVGRCVIKDYGYVGCKADVTEHMDNLCSGQRSCEIRIPDPGLDRAETQCPGDFKTYLYSGYDCLPVHNPPCRTCHNFTAIEATSRVGYLASVVTDESGCGHSQCPYLVRAQPGQRLNVTLLDFALSPRRHTMNSPLGFADPCQKYADIHERYEDPEGKWKETEKVICGGNEREVHQYISKSHAVSIKMSGNRRGGKTGQFLLKYEVVGCADYDAPRNTFMKRAGDVVDVGCVSTGEKWRLTCEDGIWLGQTGTCPAAPPNPSAVKSGTILSIPMGILIAVILAIAMIIGVFILTAGLIVIKRRRLRNAARRAAETGHPDTYIKGQYGGSLAPKDYGKGHETLRYQYPPPGVLNGYPRNRAMELRPLPEIPDDLNKPTGDPSDVTVRPGEFPNVHAAPFTPGSYYQKADDGSASRQYFVLDPEQNADSDVEDMDLRYVSGNSHKSPQQDNQDNVVKDLPCPPGTSCHHIPSCFPHHVNMNEYKETGNCSWP